MNMTTKQVIELLLNKESEIDNKINGVITELLRLGYESERGKKTVKDLKSSVEYSLEEIERIIGR